MDKINKLLSFIMVVMLSFVFAISLTACAEPEENFVPPDSEERDLTESDIYDWNEEGDASTRPDLDTGYYDPDPPETETLVNIVTGSDVTFVDGSNSISISAGSKLTQDDFDISTLDGHIIAGFAVYGTDDATATEIVSFEDISTYIPEGEVTIAPYWSSENGDMYVYGSNGLDLYHDENDVRWFSAPKASYAMVNGYPGMLITSDNSLNAGSRFRAKVAYEVKKGESYDLYYTYQNLGEESISFTIYQMFEGNSWTDSAKWYDKSESINLEAGAKSDVIQLNINKATKDDNNLLTLVKFDGNVEGFTLAASMEMVSYPVEPEAVTITLDLPDGVTVSNDWSGDQMTTQTIVLPTADQVVDTSGRQLLGWYDPATGELISSDIVISGDMTIAPYFNVGSDTATQLTFATTGDNGAAMDQATNMTLPSATTGVYCGYVKGTTLKGGAFTSSSSFRVKCNYSWNSHTVTKAIVYYVITNNGSEDISFSLNLCPSGTNITATKDIEIKAGETISVAIDFTQTNGSAVNLLTIIKFGCDGDAFDLHVGIAVEDVSSQ